MLVCCDNNFLALPHLNRYPTSLTEDFSHFLTESSRSKLIEAQSKVPQRRTGGFAAGVAAYHAAALFPATLALDLVGGRPVLGHAPRHAHPAAVAAEELPVRETGGPLATAFTWRAIWDSDSPNTFCPPSTPAGWRPALSWRRG